MNGNAFQRFVVAPETVWQRLSKYSPESVRLQSLIADDMQRDEILQSHHTPETMNMALALNRQQINVSRKQAFGRNGQMTSNPAPDVPPPANHTPAVAQVTPLRTQPVRTPPKPFTFPTTPLNISPEKISTPQDHLETTHPQEGTSHLQKVVTHHQNEMTHPQNETPRPQKDMPHLQDEMSHPRIETPLPQKVMPHLQDETPHHQNGATHPQDEMIDDASGDEKANEDGDMDDGQDELAHEGDDNEQKDELPDENEQMDDDEFNVSDNTTRRYMNAQHMREMIELRVPIEELYVNKYGHVFEQGHAVKNSNIDAILNYLTTPNAQHCAGSTAVLRNLYRVPHFDERVIENKKALENFKKKYRVEDLPVFKVGGSGKQPKFILIDRLPCSYY